MTIYNEFFHFIISRIIFVAIFRFLSTCLQFSWRINLLIPILILLFYFLAGRLLSDEENLMHTLFKRYKYNPSARPVSNSSQAVLVKMQFSLMHIKELVSCNSDLE